MMRSVCRIWQHIDHMKRIQYATCGLPCHFIRLNRYNSSYNIKHDRTYSIKGSLTAKETTSRSVVSDRKRKSSNCYSNMQDISSALAAARNKPFQLLAIIIDPKLRPRPAQGQGQGQAQAQAGPHQGGIGASVTISERHVAQAMYALSYIVQTTRNKTKLPEMLDQRKLAQVVNLLKTLNKINDNVHLGSSPTEQLKLLEGYCFGIRVVRDGVLMGKGAVKCGPDNTLDSSGLGLGWGLLDRYLLGVTALLKRMGTVPVESTDILNHGGIDLQVLSSCVKCLQYLVPPMPTTGTDGDGAHVTGPSPAVVGGFLDSFAKFTASSMELIAHGSPEGVCSLVQGLRALSTETRQGQGQGRCVSVSARPVVGAIGSALPALMERISAHGQGEPLVVPLPSLMEALAGLRFLSTKSLETVTLLEALFPLVEASVRTHLVKMQASNTADEVGKTAKSMSVGASVDSNSNSNTNSNSSAVMSEAIRSFLHKSANTEVSVSDLSSTPASASASDSGPGLAQSSRFRDTSRFVVSFLDSLQLHSTKEQIVCKYLLLLTHPTQSLSNIHPRLLQFSVSDVCCILNSLRNKSTKMKETRQLIDVLAPHLSSSMSTVSGDISRATRAPHGSIKSVGWLDELQPASKLFAQVTQAFHGLGGLDNTGVASSAVGALFPAYTHLLQLVPSFTLLTSRSKCRSMSKCRSTSNNSRADTLGNVTGQGDAQMEQPLTLTEQQLVSICYSMNRLNSRDGCGLQLYTLLEALGTTITHTVETYKANSSAASSTPGGVGDPSFLRNSESIGRCLYGLRSMDFEKAPVKSLFETIWVHLVLPFQGEYSVKGVQYILSSSRNHHPVDIKDPLARLIKHVSGRLATSTSPLQRSAAGLNEQATTRPSTVGLYTEHQMTRFPIVTLLDGCHLMTFASPAPLQPPQSTVKTSASDNNSNSNSNSNSAIDDEHSQIPMTTYNYFAIGLYRSMIQRLLDFPPGSTDYHPPLGMRETGYCLATLYAQLDSFDIMRTWTWLQSPSTSASNSNSASSSNSNSNSASVSSGSAAAHSPSGGDSSSSADSKLQKRLLLLERRRAQQSALFTEYVGTLQRLSEHVAGGIITLTEECNANSDPMSAGANGVGGLVLQQDLLKYLYHIVYPLHKVDTSRLYLLTARGDAHTKDLGVAGPIAAVTLPSPVGAHPAVSLSATIRLVMASVNGLLTSVLRPLEAGMSENNTPTPEISGSVMNILNPGLVSRMHFALCNKALGGWTHASTSMTAAAVGSDSSSSRGGVGGVGGGRTISIILLPEVCEYVAIVNIYTALYLTGRGRGRGRSVVSTCESGHDSDHGHGSGSSAAPWAPWEGHYIAQAVSGVCSLFRVSPHIHTDLHNYTEGVYPSAVGGDGREHDSVEASEDVYSCVPGVMALRTLVANLVCAIGPLTGSLSDRVVVDTESVVLLLEACTTIFSLPPVLYAQLGPSSGSRTAVVPELLELLVKGMVPLVQRYRCADSMTVESCTQQWDTTASQQLDGCIAALEHTLLVLSDGDQNTGNASAHTRYEHADRCTVSDGPPNRPCLVINAQSSSTSTHTSVVDGNVAPVDTDVAVLTAFLATLKAMQH